MAKRSKRKRLADREVFTKPAGKGALVPTQSAWLGRAGVWWWPVLAIFVATMVVYTPALRGGFIWSDEHKIVGYEFLRTWHGLWQIWFEPGTKEQYYPLSFTVYWLEYRLWGLNTLGYHVVNVLLQSLAAVLLWQLLASLRVRGALLAGAIFALHPVNVMSVAWLTDLKNILPGCFVLGAAWAYVRFAGLGIYNKQDGPGEGGAGKPEWFFYFLALALFLLAMLAKTAVSFLPVSLLLILWWQKKRVTLRDLFSLIPMVGIGIGMGMVTIYNEQYFRGASDLSIQFGFIDRVLVSGRSFWFYLGKLLFPYHLAFMYEQWQIDARAWWQYLYPLATMGLLAGLWMARGRIGKGVWVAFMHFYITTSMLVLIEVLTRMRYSFVSDHWQYFGAVGMFALFAAGLTAGLDWLGLEGKPTGLVLKLGLLLVLGTLSWQQAWAYKSDEALWNDTLAKNPNCWMAHNNLGNDLLDKGQVDEAMAEFQKVLEIDRNDAEAHYNLGNALLQKGQVDEAIAEYQKALAIKPNYAEAHYNFGNALMQEGQVDEALGEYQKALEIDPNDAEVHNNYGTALLQEGRLDEAMAQYQLALQIDPDFAEAHTDFGMVLLKKGQVDEAITEYQKALAIDPNLAEIHYDLGNALFQKGLIDEAIAEYLEALRLKPDYSHAQHNLAIAQAIVAQRAAQK
ncbi:MAG: tetratricopeptide repeat protein [Methylacidiphilales bacterium]|nr:tetratricopeptide repeat protein [Candidatus Methylacidiphilales bacterium]